MHFAKAINVVAALVPSACLIRSVLEKKHRNLDFACIALVLKSVLPCNCAMRNIKSALGLAAAISLAFTAFALAADAKFRADGTIQRMSDTMVLVRTSAQDIEITRDAKTKITGELRRGGAVTVMYAKVGGQNIATEIIMGGAAKPK